MRLPKMTSGLDLIRAIEMAHKFPILGREPTIADSCFVRYLLGLAHKHLYAPAHARRIGRSQPAEPLPSARIWLWLTWL